MENRFIYGKATLPDFKRAMSKYGWVIYEQALTEDFVDTINIDLVEAYVRRRKIQEKNGIGGDMSGTMHHLLQHDNFGLKFLEQMYCDKEISYFLKGKYILNGINAVINSKQDKAYVSNMHRDVRSFMCGMKYLVQMIVSLDEFTLQNGATYFLSGSHKKNARPDETYFYTHADRAVMDKGSIVLFNSNIWHAAGENKTPYPRRALTLGFTRPFIKPQMDYTRLLGDSFVSGLNPNLRQVIGYNARVPESLDEYYQPVHLRKYQRDQG